MLDIQGTEVKTLKDITALNLVWVNGNQHVSKITWTSKINGEEIFVL